MDTLLVARVNAHQNNIERYCRLLSTDLTPHERAYLHRRIVEERLALEQLEADRQQSSISGSTRHGHQPSA